MAQPPAWGGGGATGLLGLSQNGDKRQQRVTKPGRHGVAAGRAPANPLAACNRWAEDHENYEPRIDRRNP
jgi:hypothetical protein